MGRKSQGNPTFTKATYDHKRPICNPLSSAQLEAEQADKARQAAKDRAFNKHANHVGLAKALFPDQFPQEEPIKRRD
jgi:hypothetical protein